MSDQQRGQQRDIVSRFYADFMPNGKAEEALADVHPDFVNHASPPGSPQGRENIRSTIAWLAGAFTDQRYDVHHLVVEGDVAAVHCTWHATHTGEFLGIPATGRTFASDQVHLMRFQDGMVIEHWAVRDDLGMLRQMGIAPG